MCFMCCCSIAQSWPTLQPHGLQHVRLPCPSPSPGVCSNSCPLSQRHHISMYSLIQSSQQHDLHFTEQNIEKQCDSATCPGSHSQQLANPRLSPAAVLLTIPPQEALLGNTSLISGLLQESLPTQLSQLPSLSAWSCLQQQKLSAPQVLDARADRVIPHM